MNFRFKICDRPSRKRQRPVSCRRTTTGRSRLRLGRSGFTFLEVLFAVIVLGIGFIMVAAMFPAAIRQTQSTVEDSAAGSVWIDMHRKFIEMAKDPVAPGATVVSPYYLDTNLVPTGPVNQSKVFSFNDARLTQAQRWALWRVVGPNLLFEADARYACVPLYRREAPIAGAPAGTIGAPEAQLFLFPVHSRNKPEYDVNDLSGPSQTAKTMSNLDPTRFTAKVMKPTAGSPLPTIVFTQIFDYNRQLQKSPSGVTEDSPLAPGAYVVVSDCPQPVKNGSIYRLGARVQSTDPTTYFITPDSQGASDVYQAGFASYTADVFVVGRGISTQGGATFDGPAQDLGVVPVTVPLPH